MSILTNEQMDQFRNLPYEQWEQKLIELKVRGMADQTQAKVQIKAYLGQLPKSMNADTSGIDQIAAAVGVTGGVGGLILAQKAKSILGGEEVTYRVALDTGHLDEHLSKSFGNQVYINSIFSLRGGSISVTERDGTPLFTIRVSVNDDQTTIQMGKLNLEDTKQAGGDALQGFGDALKRGMGGDLTGALGALMNAGSDAMAATGDALLREKICNAVDEFATRAEKAVQDKRRQAREAQIIADEQKLKTKECVRCGQARASGEIACSTCGAPYEN